MKAKFIVLISMLTWGGLGTPLLADPLGEPPLRDRDMPRMPLLGDLKRADQIIGSEIKDDQDHKLGKVEDLALDLSNGHIVEVIVGSGGFLGIDRKIMAIPPQSFVWDSSAKELRLSVTRDQLKRVPEFSLLHWTESTENSHIREVYQRYGVEPYFKDDQPTPALKPDADLQPGQVTRYYSFNGNNALPKLGYISRASKLMGTTVWNLANEKLARVQDFTLNLPAGRVAEVVVGTGATIHSDAELTAVPPQSFHWNADKTALTLDSTQDALKAAPHFAANEYNWASRLASVRDIYSLYHVQPYFAMTDTESGAQNVRERVNNPVGELEKGNREDLKIADQIHRAVMARESLSMDARNVKIVTVDGSVTLIGSVASEDEKRQLSELAAKIVPADKVDNQLQVRNAAILPTVPPLPSPDFR